MDSNDFNSILRKYSRYLLIIFNLLFVITGVIILSVGISVKAYFKEFEPVLDRKYFYASDLLIIIGVIIFLIAFFGCCGALKENACMTLTFSTLLIVIMILEVFVGIGGVLLGNKAETMVKEQLNKTMEVYGNSSKETTALWDNVQEKFNCCGIDNYTDWYPHTDHMLPLSCCTLPVGQIGNYTCDANSPQLHNEGCAQVFAEYIEGHAVSIESVGLGLAVVQLLGIMLSCYLSKQIKSDYETV